MCQLQQAKRAFAMQARGPACDRYLEQLEQECEQVWKNGRQMCEELSLTGNHCVNEVSGWINILYSLNLAGFLVLDKIWLQSDNLSYVFICTSTALCLSYIRMYQYHSQVIA